MKCPACGNAGRGVLRATSDFEVLRCPCGFFYRGELADTSNPVYDYSERAGVPLEQLYGALTTARYRELLDSLSRKVAGRRVLDVGCGQGHFVYAASEAGWDVLGIEPSPSGVGIARSFGLPCEVGDVKTAPGLTASSFDVVTLIEVIEHVEDPRNVLAGCAALVKPGGVIYLTTPNYASLGRRLLGHDWPYLAPDHLSYFTPASLRRMAATVGLEGKVRTRNLSAAATHLLIRRRMDSLAEGDAEQDLRHQIERRRSLRAAKALVNVGLRATGLGETLTAELRHA